MVFVAPPHTHTRTPCLSLFHRFWVPGYLENGIVFDTTLRFLVLQSKLLYQTVSGSWSLAISTFITIYSWFLEVFYPDGLIISDASMFNGLTLLQSGRGTVGGITDTTAILYGQVWIIRFSRRPSGREYQRIVLVDEWENPQTKTFFFGHNFTLRLHLASWNFIYLFFFFQIERAAHRKPFLDYKCTYSFGVIRQLMHSRCILTNLIYTTN